MSGDHGALPLNMRRKITFTDSGCWQWTGCLNSKGYGCTSFDGCVQLTHRVAYSVIVGPIPSGLVIDHLCRNRACCNPRHLEPVTGKVNAERGMNATKLRCLRGHPLVAPNLSTKSRVNGLVFRNCRVCASDAARAKRLAAGARTYSGALARRAKILAAAETALARLSDRVGATS